VNSLFRVSALVAFAVLLAACQPRIQPIYAPSSVLMPQGLETAPLSVIRDGILDAGAEKGWVMEELEPGLIQGTLGVRGKHEAVVDVQYNNQTFDINYVSSRNLLSQGTRIHRSYNAWVRDLETSIYNNLGYVATAYKNNPTAPAPAITSSATPVFDPTGFWDVWATYTPTGVSPAICSKKRSWNFQLDYRKRGVISETYWSSDLELNVSGEHSEDYAELVFSVPEGGTNWQLTKRLKLDRPRVRLTSEPKTGASSTHSSHSTDCIGVLNIDMKKLNNPTQHAANPATPQKSAPAPAPAAPAKSAPLVATAPPTETKFSAKGNWNVRANYIPEATNTTVCPRTANWNFTLALKDGKISETYYSNQWPLYVTGEMDGDFLDLRFEVPAAGSDYKWAERFKLDQPSKRLRAVSEDGYCIGAIDIHMEKQTQTATATASQTTPKKAAAIAPAATEADIAWRAIKGNNDEQELRLFLKDHGESKYAETAISALNGVLKKQDPSSFPAFGTWRVTAKYEASTGNSAYCARSHLWNFDLSLTAPMQSFTFWTGREGLYVNSETINGKIVLAVNYPRGGNNWQWADHFKLDQEQKTFLSEAQDIGGPYAGCIGNIVFTMKKLSNTG